MDQRSNAEKAICSDLPNLKSRQEGLKAQRKELCKKKANAESVIKSESKNLTAAKAKLAALMDSLSLIGIGK